MKEEVGPSQTKVLPPLLSQSSNGNLRWIISEDLKEQSG